jgi:acyl-coenzyme A synthetase/AMP-(fatty) acid ligase
VPHRLKGFAPAAMMVLCEGARDAPLKAFCRERGPLYSHPRHIAVMPAVPSDGAGRIDRATVQARLRGGMDRAGQNSMDDPS